MYEDKNFDYLFVAEKPLAEKKMNKMAEAFISHYKAIMDKLINHCKEIEIGFFKFMG